MRRSNRQILGDVRGRPQNAASDWYRTILNKSTGSADVWIYDDIGLWGTTAAEFIAELKTLDASPLDVRIASRGGDVFDGLAIFNALRTHAKPVRDPRGVGDVRRLSRRHAHLRRHAGVPILVDSRHLW
jgi:hypothetical protein